jgi:hypothetical protein
MNEEILYRKIGRKYVPYVHTYDDLNLLLKPGEYVMVYMHSDTWRSYSYTARPDTAGFRAAALAFVPQAAAAMDKAKLAKPMTTTRYTKKQLEIIERYRAEMAETGALLPSHWQHVNSHDIFSAAIKAFAPD